jgi:hypothetical protein
MDRPEPPRPGADRGSMLIAAAIIGAAFVLSWGMSISEPRYQIATSGDGVVRMDMDSGEVLACNTRGCSQIEPPDRAKTLGLIGLGSGQAKNKQLPAPETNEAATK